jgi:hypothetical protein
MLHQLRLRYDFLFIFPFQGQEFGQEFEQKTRFGAQESLWLRAFWEGLPYPLS